MKRQYDKQEITRILGKFMTGETSLEEEKMLADAEMVYSRFPIKIRILPS